MARFIRFRYVGENHLLNLEHVVNVIRVEKEPAVTYISLVNGVNEEYYGDEATALWDALDGLDVVDRSVRVSLPEVTTGVSEVSTAEEKATLMGVCMHCGHSLSSHKVFLFGEIGSGDKGILWRCEVCGCKYFEEAEEDGGNDGARVDNRGMLGRLE